MRRVPQDLQVPRRYPELEIFEVGRHGPGQARDRRKEDHRREPPDDPRGGPPERDRQHPHPVPRRPVGAVLLLLPVRRQGAGCAHADPGLLHPSLGRHGGGNGHAGNPAIPQGRAGDDALKPLRRLPGAVPAGLPGGGRHPGLHLPGGAGQVPGRHPRGQGAQPPARRVRPRVHAALRGEWVPAQPGGRARGHRLHQALRGRPRSRRERAVPPHAGPLQRQAGCRRGRRAGRPLLRLLPGLHGIRRPHLREPARGGRHAALRHPGVPPAQGGPRSGGQPDPGPGGEAVHQHDPGQGLQHHQPGEEGLRCHLPGTGSVGQLQDAGAERERHGSAARHRLPAGLRTTTQGRPPRSGPGGRRRQHGHRLRTLGPAPGRGRGAPAVPSHPQRDARQRDGDRRGRARGDRHGLPRGARAGSWSPRGG